MPTSTHPAPTRSTALFSALAGLTALAILLQGLWAGLFLPAGKGGPYAVGWVDVHATGGLVATVLALATTVVAVARLRDRRDLWVGSAVLTVLLVLEGILGGRIEDGTGGTAAVHVPLALAIMSLAVWLPLRARYAGSA